MKLLNLWSTAVISAKAVSSLVIEGRSEVQHSAYRRSTEPDNQCPCVPGGQTVAKLKAFLSLCNGSLSNILEADGSVPSFWITFPIGIKQCTIFSTPIVKEQQR